MTDSTQAEVDPREPSERLLRDLRSRREGLSQREAFGVALLNSDVSERLAIPLRTEQLMAAMALIDEILVCNAQLHGRVGAERRAQLESAIAVRAEMIKRYLDAMDRS